MGIYIDDGQNRQGYIKANPGLHDELRFDYRPCTGTDLMMFLDKCSGKNNVQIYQKRIELVHKKVASWYEGDEEVTPTQEIIKKLEMNLFTRLFSIVMGEETSDDDPNYEQESADMVDSQKN